MPPAPYFSQPRPNTEPAWLGFRFCSTNRLPCSARARSLYFGLPPAQLPCPFHHPHSWHALLLLFVRLGQYQVHALSIGCRRAKTFPPLDLSIPASHNLKHPFCRLFHIQSTLPANNFHPRLLVSATRPLMALSGGCPAPSRSLQLPLAGKCPWPT